MSVTQNNERVEVIGDQLRAKITSKFTASTFLAGFALTILSGQVFMLWQSAVLPWLFPLAVGIVAAAVVLFVAAVLRLDQLTMPKRFWDESKDANDTGHSSRAGYLLDEDLWELRKHMIFYWQRLTLVATVMTGSAVLIMLFPIQPLSTERLHLATFVFALLGLGLGLAYDQGMMALARKAKDEPKRLKRLIRQPD
jgi:MFS family permease